MFLFLLTVCTTLYLPCHAQSTLNTLAIEYNSTKSSSAYNYTKYYTEHIEVLRNKPITFLEINNNLSGLFSAKMWDTYFIHPQAKLIFANNNPNFINNIKEFSSRCTLWTLNPEDSNHCEQLKNSCGSFDIVINAGPHTTTSQHNLFSILLPQVKPNGIYTIEGLYCSYPKTIPHVDGHNLAHDPALPYCTKNKLVHSEKDSMVHVLKTVVDELNNSAVQSPLNYHPHYWAHVPEEYEMQWPQLLAGTDKDIASIHFYPNVCIIKKKEATRSLHNVAHPIQFSIPACKVVSSIPQKTRDFAFIVPGDFKTYIYNDEQSYYKGYQEAYYGITTCKIGWDCMRHYEILANGCIPYFLNLEQCHLNTMKFLPKELILEAMHLPGVSYNHIDHSIFDTKRYFKILKQLLEHTRKYLTSQAMARYILNTIDYQDGQKILYLFSMRYPTEYMRDLTLIGLREEIGPLVTDYPKNTVVYDIPFDKNLNLYGNGFSYSKILPDIDIDRSSIEQRIANKEFAYVFYMDIHRELPFYSLVTQYYPDEKIVYICGAERHTGSPFTHYCGYRGNVKNLFIREWSPDMAYDA